MNRLVVGALALLMGAASMAACSSDDDNNVEATGGQGNAAGAEATGGSTGGNASAGAENGGSPEATGGTAGNGPASQGGMAGAPPATSGAPATQGGAAGAPMTEGGSAGTPATEGGKGGGMAEGGAGGATGFNTGNVCENDDDCSEDATCFDGICVMTGALQFTLTWEGETDLDLYVVEPDGDYIYWGTYEAENPAQADSPLGYLDVDDCAYYDDTYHCRTTGTHVENIFFDAPTDGEYTVYVSGFETGGETVDFTITATVDGDEQTPWTGSVDDDEEAGTNISEFFYVDYGN